MITVDIELDGILSNMTDASPRGHEDSPMAFVGIEDDLITSIIECFFEKRLESLNLVLVDRRS